MGEHDPISPVNSLRPLPADRFDYWRAQHLLNRAGFGGTPGQVRALANLGLEAAVAYIVDYESIEAEPVRADAFDRDIIRPRDAEEAAAVRMARRSGDERALEELRRRRQEAQRADRLQIADLQRWWLSRMIESPRPLEEKLTLFWHGHFATGYRAIEDSYQMFQQNEFFRRNASGRFFDLVYGIIRDPAMLRYLNNNQSRREAPNENLARELMELFTLGEGNVYTESDIREGARALTGYNVDDDQFDFRPALHDGGSKTIFGRTGEFDGEDFCRLILQQRVCSEFICWKLYRFFVNDRPGIPDENVQGFILRLARLMRDREYDLKAVLRTLFMSEHFYADCNVASLVKSPTQLIVQAIRSLRTPVRSLAALVAAGDMMGQSLFFPPSVKGWDGGRAWINTSTLFVRQNLMVYLLTGRRPDGYEWDRDGAPFDAMHLVEDLRRPASGDIDTRDAATYLLRFNLGAEPHPDRVDTLAAYVGSDRSPMQNNLVIALLALITAMPEYQLC